MSKFYHFLSDDAGAVTIDWVALTAGILLLGIAIVYVIFQHGVAPLVTDINETLAGAAIGMDCTATEDGTTTCTKAE